MGKRGPKPGTGGRPRIPADAAAPQGGSPKVFFRLEPAVKQWLDAKGGPLYAKQLVLDAYEAEQK